MADTTQIVAKAAEQGGAAIAISSAVVGFLNQTFNWLNHNSAGVLALCGVGGLIISWMGYRSSVVHRAKLLDFELRQKSRRSNEHFTE